MNYQLALSSELGLSHKVGGTAWNDDPLLRSQAEVHLSSKSADYFDPRFLGMGINFVIGVGTSSSALYELI